MKFVLTATPEKYSKMSSIKEKYLLVSWCNFLAEKVELGTIENYNFKVQPLVPTIENVVAMLNDCRLGYTFEYLNNFLKCQKDGGGAEDELSIKAKPSEESLWLDLDNKQCFYGLERTYNNLKVAKEILALFHEKLLQKDIKKKLKSQLTCLGYQPKAIKKNCVHDKIIRFKAHTKHGKLILLVDKNGCKLHSINGNEGSYSDVQEIEEKIERLKKEIVYLENMADKLNEIKSEISNCAISYEPK